MPIARQLAGRVTGQHPEQEEVEHQHREQADDRAEDAANDDGGRATGEPSPVQRGRGRCGGLAGGAFHPRRDLTDLCCHVLRLYSRSPSVARLRASATPPAASAIAAAAPTPMSTPVLMPPPLLDSDGWSMLRYRSVP